TVPVVGEGRAHLPLHRDLRPRRREGAARHGGTDGRERLPRRARGLPAGGGPVSGRTSFGRTELPEEQEAELHRAVRLAWLTIAFLLTAVTAVYLAMGSSQAMKA